MYLTREQEDILNGSKGEGTAMLMNILVRLGDIYGAEDLVPIGSAQVSGISYKSIGEPGTQFLEDVASGGAKASVLTYSNPAGMDLQAWKDMGISEDFAKNQMRIINALRKIGVMIIPTCVPYLSGNLPRFGEHIAWAESSAISFANSVIGARTNREGGPAALAAAVCGVTPRYGLHLSENRQPTVIVDVDASLTYNSDYAALGYYIGKEIGGIPYFRGLGHANTDQLKALGAAMAASGSVALYHAEGLTPEAGSVELEGLEKVSIGQKEIDSVYETLNTADDPDIIIFGCPHASLKEISQLAAELDGKELKKPVWVCTSRTIKDAADSIGLSDVIKKAGGTVVADTCMVVSPLETLGYRTTGVNSGKAANYLPGFCHQKVVFRNMKELIRRALV